MKLLKKSIVASMTMALAVGLVACSDDEEISEQTTTSAVPQPESFYSEEDINTKPGPNDDSNIIVGQENYDVGVSRNDLGNRPGWTEEEWDHIMGKRYHLLPEEKVFNTDDPEQFTANLDFQVTTGGAIVNNQFVGDPDDLVQLLLMERDAEPIGWGHPEYSEAIELLNHWSTIHDEQTLADFKKIYLPFVPGGSEFKYSIPGEHSVVLGGDYYAFRNYTGNIVDAKLNNNYMVGKIETSDELIPFALFKESDGWKMMNPMTEAKDLRQEYENSKSNMNSGELNE